MTDDAQTTSDSDEPAETPQEVQDFAEEERQALSPLVLQLGPKNIEMEMRGKVSEALRQPLLPPDLEYMLIAMVMPTQGGPMPAFALTLAVPMGTLDQSRCQWTGVLPSPWMSQDDLNDVIRQASESVVQMRTQALSAEMKNGTPQG